MSNTYLIPYGRRQIDIELPETIHPDWISPKDVPGSKDPVQLVEDALDHPVGSHCVEDFRQTKTVAIAINDKTRPVPNEVLLPPLLRRLENLDISPDHILLMIASGTHTPMKPEEFPLILPEEILRRYPVISHNCDDASSLIQLGTTTRGTSVSVNRRFYEADLKIVVGNIDPHHFMGYSGAAKSASVGLSARETINQNHSMLILPNTKTGHYEDNPMRQDVEEIGQMMGLDFALNAILNLNKEIVHVIAGDPIAVMQKGIPLVQEICQVKVHQLYDLVIVSPGGYPKDINFYQSQKALTHAALLTREGGAILLAAACPEGVGSEGYRQWMEGVHSHTEVIEKFKAEGFRVGPHKAFQIAQIAGKVKIALVSQIPEDAVRKLLITPYPTLNDAIRQFLPALPNPIRVAILPRGTSTAPLVIGEKPKSH